MNTGSPVRLLSVQNGAKKIVLIRNEENKPFLLAWSWSPFPMRIFLLNLLVAVCLFGSQRALQAASVERDWVILHYYYSGALPEKTSKPEGLEKIAASPRIYSGLVSRFTRVRLAGNEILDLPASYPVRLASGDWRSPGKLEAGDRIPFRGRVIRVVGADPHERSRPVRLYVIETQGPANDLRIAAGRLTENAQDLRPSAAEEGFCARGGCGPRLGLLYSKPGAFAGSGAWFSSFFSIEDFAQAYAGLASPSHRRREKAAAWIRTNGTPRQKAVLKLFGHNAGWAGMELSRDEYYRNLERLDKDAGSAATGDGRAMTWLQREILRHHFGREVDRAPGPAREAVVQAVAEEPESGPVVDWPAIGRSALLPGWGDTYRGRSGAGYAFTGAFLASGAFALFEYNRAVQFGVQYEAQALQADIAALVLSKSFGRETILIQSFYLNNEANETRKDYRRSALNAINAGGLAALVYAISLGHVSYHAVSWPDPEQPEESAQLIIHGGPAGDSLQFSVMVRW